MNRIRLKSLILTGSTVEPASVVFNENLTVIYGASDTGKTYIARAIDFMLGTTKMKRIPEATAYTDVFLRLEASGSDDWVLGRKTSGGQFSRWLGSDSIPPEGKSNQYSAKHNAKRSASKLFLRELGLTGLRTVKNVHGESREVSFRDVAHLCVIGETDIQAERTPVLSGQRTGWTAEKGAFRVLVDGEDDPAAHEQVPNAAKRQASTGKADLLARLIRELEDNPAGQGALVSLEERLVVVRSSIQRLSQELTEAADKRAELIQQSADLQRETSARKAALLETTELLHRFELLASKYRSDTARLAMIEEAGNLLGFLHQGPCPFCGTPLANQPEGELHLASEATDLSESIDAEAAKTQALHDDLQLTIEGVQTRRASISDELTSLGTDSESVRRHLVSLDVELKPRSTDIAELVEASALLERGVAIRRQIDKYELMKSEFTDSAAPIRSGANTQMSDGLGRFARTVEFLLKLWGVPDVGEVSLDLRTYELIVGGQERGDRGKGMRSIIHAAFTVGLALYCIENDLPHPGFVVLDSPLVTYRGPASDRTAVDLADEALPATVASAFFQYLAHDFPGQSIVLENTDPPDSLSTGITSTQFTKSAEGRYGFFPS